jgi:hypothetical protein
VGRIVVLSISLVTVQAAAHAQSETQDSRSQGQSPPAPPKNPPPPLFPKHRRGIYRNLQGLEVIDATPQSPPLETDDPGVPDKGEYELNLTTHADLSHDVQRFDLLFVDVNYGMLPKIAGREFPTQMKFECPLAAVNEHGDPFTVGAGAATFGLKFQVFSNEHSGVAVSVYPQVEFGIPGAGSVEKGLAESGQTLILPLLLLKEFKYLTLVANGGVNEPVRDPERDATATAGIGVGRAMTRKVAAMVELRTESTLDLRRNRLAVVNAGVMRGVRTIIVYAQAGRSLFSDDGSKHAYIGVGVKLLVKPKERRT